MIHDADRSLAAWLGDMLPPGTAVRLDTPDPAWARRPPEQPFVNVFLYDIAEDADGLTTDASLVRDSGGHPVAWQPPVRRYLLSYLLTAWSGDVPAEHQLLGRVLAGCASAAVIPADCLRGTLREAGFPVQVRCAPSRETPGPGAAGPPGLAGTAGLCQALRVPPRAALPLVMVTPLLPAPRTDVAPPARSLDLNAAAMARDRQAPALRRPLPSSSGPRRWERTRITEHPA